MCIAVEKRTTKNNYHIPLISPRLCRLSPISLSKTSHFETLLLLDRPPHCAPNAHHAPFQRYPQTITPRQAMKLGHRIQKPLDFSASFNPSLRKPRQPCDQFGPITTVPQLPKSLSAPHPPFRTLQLPQLVIHYRIRLRLDHFHRGRIHIARHTAPGP